MDSREPSRLAQLFAARICQKASFKAYPGWFPSANSDANLRSGVYYFAELEMLAVVGVIHQTRHGRIW